VTHFQEETFQYIEQTRNWATMINISMINLKFLYVNISTVSYNVDNIIPMSYMDLF